MTKGERTYGQYCPIAAGLDVVGDRWVLLICRELVMGDRRFTDLRKALPGLAPNLLIERLRSLEAAGLVTTADLPPPAARTVYRLTDEGREVTPVLRAMARFGVRHLEGAPQDTLSARRAAHALMLPWRRALPAHMHARLVTTDGDEIDLLLDGTETRVARPDGVADVTLRVDVADLVQARRDGTPLAATISGARDQRAKLLEAFGLRLAPR
jgi:DNA-binding HxlR family transcriptional regulator